MRPIPAQRIGHAHGLLRALAQRGKLRLEDFESDFSEPELFPPDLEEAAGRTRQLVLYARAAGLVREERGAVELTEPGERYADSADAGDVFAVSAGQAEWLRRQLREKHLLESIWNGAAVALSLYASLEDGDWVAAQDVGRCAAHLARVDWDDEQTFRSQGERLTYLLEDMELIGPGRRVTATGRATLEELRLPPHTPLKELAAQLHPAGADGAARAAAEERDALELGPAPAARAAAESVDVLSDSAIKAPEDDPAAPGHWVDAERRATADPSPIAGPDEPTRSYPVLSVAAAGVAGSSVAEAAAPDLPALAPTEPQAAQEAAASEPGAGSGLTPSFQSGIRPAPATTATHPVEDAFLDPSEVRAAAERRGLVLDPGVYAAAIAALASGRHLVLTGSAGSGKTALALAIAEAAVQRGHCKSVLFTAAAGLSASEVLGRAIKKDRWLVVDELDRVRLDDALGEVSTVLGGHTLELPGGAELSPPSGWRLIATMAGIDQVGETTAALRRRFVFVEMPGSERAGLEELVGTWAGDDETAAAVGRRLVAVNDVVALGPGLYRDAVAYVKARRTLTDASEDDLTIEALAGFVLPQLEGEADEVAAAAVRAAGFDG